LTEDQSTEEDLDETIEETFPASDAPGNTVITGARVAPLVKSGPELHVFDNAKASRYELNVDGQIATLEYARRPKAVVLVHTDVPSSLRGRGIASALAAFAIDAARREGLLIVARCPFVRAYLRKHPQIVGPDISLQP
jgi:predicted GNAT family acetyltransferase